jgi:predicted amidophosphoribosyltransferase
MAQELSRNLKIVSEPKALYRTRATRDQTGLNRPERIENMRGAFVVAPSARLKDLSILLVDDVTTTGATAREAALALGAGGAKKIFLAVAAVAGEDFQQ